MARSRRVTGCLTIIAVTAILAGLLITREVYLAVTATPGSAIDYHARMMELIDESQPEGRDGWTDFEQAISAMKRVNAEVEPELMSNALYLTLDHSRYGEGYAYPLEDYLSAAERIVARMGEEGVWDNLDRLAATPRAIRDTSGQQIDRIVLDLMLPDLGDMRQMSRTLAARMRLAHQDGRDDDAARAFEHGLAIARVAGSQATLIEHLVSIAISSLMVGELQRELVERPHDEAALRRMIQALDRQEPVGMRLALEGERISTLDTIQWTHTDDGSGDGRLILTELGDIGSITGVGGPPFPRFKIVNMASVAFPSKRKTTQLAEASFDALLERSAMTYAERQRTPPPPALAAPIPSRQVLLRMLLPAVSTALDAADRGQTLVSGAKLALAIELYRIEHGAYPETLDDLVPSVLDELPVDPLADSGRVGYKPLSADPHGRNYLLYSTSFDGVDDGGTFDPIKDMAPGAQTGGFDLILNHPRAPEGGG